MAGHYDFREDYPQITAYFIVDIGGTTLSVNEVSGLAEELEEVTYRAGDRADGYTSKRAGLPKAGDVTFSKCIIAGDANFEDLFHKWRDDRSYNSDQGERVDIGVTLIDENEADVAHWNLVACWPKKIEWPTLKGDESAVAFEKLTFSVEEIHGEIL